MIVNATVRLERGGLNSALKEFRKRTSFVRAAIKRHEQFTKPSMAKRLKSKKARARLKKQAAKRVEAEKRRLGNAT